MAKDGIDLHFDDEEGHLRIECAAESFEQIRSLILAEAAASDDVGPYRDAIRSIAVRGPAASGDGPTDPHGRRLRIALVATAIALSLGIQAVGIAVVARWLLGIAP